MFSTFGYSFGMFWMLVFGFSLIKALEGLPRSSSHWIPVLPNRPWRHSLRRGSTTHDKLPGQVCSQVSLFSSWHYGSRKASRKVFILKNLISTRSFLIKAEVRLLSCFESWCHKGCISWNRLRFIVIALVCNVLLFPCIHAFAPSLLNHIAALVKKS